MTVFARALLSVRAGVALMSAVAVATGWLAAQWVEDHHHRAAFARDLARSRAADSGLDPAEMRRAFESDPAAAVAFLARDADELLAAETRRVTGYDGLIGRWLQRQGAGIRLASAGARNFGLDTGWIPSALAQLLELGGALLLSWRVAGVSLRRWRSRARGR